MGDIAKSLHDCMTTKTKRLYRPRRAGVTQRKSWSKFYYMMATHKGDAGAVNQLVFVSLPWFQSPFVAWELGHVWLHIKPFHYMLDPAKALCDLASVSISPPCDCTPTHTHTVYTFTPTSCPQMHTATHTLELLEPRIVADKANVNL